MIRELSVGNGTENTDTAGADSCTIDGWVMHEICGILMYKHVHNPSIIPCATTPHTFGRDLNKAKDSYLNEPFELIIPLSSSFVGLNRSQTTKSSG